MPVNEFPQCLKITEKVSFNIASETSYVYILIGQKLIKNAKNGEFWPNSNATFWVIFKHCVLQKTRVNCNFADLLPRRRL